MPGIGQHIYYFSKYIRNKTIIYTKKYFSNPLHVPKNATLHEIVYNDLPFRREKENLVYFILLLFSKIWGEITYFSNIFYSIKKNKYKVSIIHLHSINYLFAAVVLKRIFDAPLVISFGGTDLIRLKQYGVLKWLSQFSNKVLYVASSMRPDLLKVFPSSKLVYMGNGVDLSQFLPKRLKRKKQFIAIGNLRWQKGYKYMIKAFYDFTKGDNHYKLLIAGEGDDRGLLEQLISDLGLNNRVFLLGTCNRAVVNKLLNESEVYILSSISEGFPKTIIESIACGTPMIVTNIGECGNIAQNVGEIVEPMDTHAMSNAMLSIVNNKKQWNNYHKNCLQKREKYDWSVMVKKVDNVYKQLLQIKIDRI